MQNALITSLSKGQQHVQIFYHLMNTLKKNFLDKWIKTIPLTYITDSSKNIKTRYLSYLICYMTVIIWMHFFSRFFSQNVRGAYYTQELYN